VHPIVTNTGAWERVSYWRSGGANLKVGHVAKIPRPDTGPGVSSRSDRRVRSARGKMQ
jgi:hypothetical protein